MSGSPRGTKRAAFAKDRKSVFMLLFICFLLGVANFAMHKAVAESGHPVIEDTRRILGKHFGPHGSYAMELALLIGAMWLANDGAVTITIVYAAYTAINGVATWMLLSGKA